LPHLRDPPFAFGESLGHTTVAYSTLALREQDVPVDGTIHATVRLTNTGDRPALETVQAFVRTEILPGESADFDIEIPASRCSLVGADNQRVVEPGEFELRVGTSSQHRHHLTARFRVIDMHATNS